MCEAAASTALSTWPGAFIATVKLTSTYEPHSRVCASCRDVVIHIHSAATTSNNRNEQIVTCCRTARVASGFPNYDSAHTDLQRPITNRRSALLCTQISGGGGAQINGSKLGVNTMSAHVAMLIRTYILNVRTQRRRSDSATDDHTISVYAVRSQVEWMTSSIAASWRLRASLSSSSLWWWSSLTMSN